MLGRQYYFGDGRQCYLGVGATSCLKVMEFYYNLSNVAVDLLRKERWVMSICFFHDSGYSTSLQMVYMTVIGALFTAFQLTNRPCCCFSSLDG